MTLATIVAAFSVAAQLELQFSRVIIHSERDVSLSEQAGVPFVEG